MTIVQKCATLMAVALVGATIFVAGPAQAATCVTVPGATPGTGVTIAGDDYRVPSVSHVSVCAADGSIPLVDVETSGGYCSAACLAVVVQGSDVDSGGFTISYRLDGVITSRTVDPGGVGGPGDSCLLGVGVPRAPRSECAFAVEPDELPVDVDALVADAVEDAERIAGDWGEYVGDTIEDAEDTVAETRAEVDRIVQDLPDAEQMACDTIPSIGDPNGWGEETRFCEDPAGWARALVQGIGMFVAETIEPIQDLLRDRPTPAEIAEAVCRMVDRLSCG